MLLRTFHKSFLAGTACVKNDRGHLVQDAVGGVTGELPGVVPFAKSRL